MTDITLSNVQLLVQVIDEAVTARRRSAAKSTRPQFKEVYDREVAELLSLKPLVEHLNGQRKAGSTTR